MVVAWIVLGLVLVGVELQHWAFFALFAALGAFAAGAVAAVTPHHYAWQLVAFAVVTVIGILAVRPFVSRALGRRRGDHVATGVHGGLVGQRVLTLDAVGDGLHPGHVRLAGERWLAVTAPGMSIPPETPVLVVAVSGTTLTVTPVDG